MTSECEIYILRKDDSVARITLPNDDDVDFWGLIDRYLPTSYDLIDESMIILGIPGDVTTLTYDIWVEEGEDSKLHEWLLEE